MRRGGLRAKRETLLSRMRAKFGAVPAAVAKVIAAIENGRRLDTLLRRVLTARTVDDMALSRNRIAVLPAPVVGEGSGSFR